MAPDVVVYPSSVHIPRPDIPYLRIADYSSCNPDAITIPNFVIDLYQIRKKALEVQKV
ncbi:hypothetical protein Glove_157g78 [Diversispora epigaea]|uniref:Uncharacterized protein n=1 Tax=Diversispora epigaea TaxID=1348612 RepID=A0A397J1C5_9GLOM|nr:hypothetical protein Glove_157g78 [Diversispora epigaea]